MGEFRALTGGKKKDRAAEKRRAFYYFGDGTEIIPASAPYGRAGERAFRYW